MRHALPHSRPLPRKVTLVLAAANGGANSLNYSSSIDCRCCCALCCITHTCSARQSIDSVRRAIDAKNVSSTSPHERTALLRTETYRRVATASQRPAYSRIMRPPLVDAIDTFTSSICDRCQRGPITIYVPMRRSRIDAFTSSICGRRQHMRITIYPMVRRPWIDTFTSSIRGDRHAVRISLGAETRRHGSMHLQFCTQRRMTQ